MEFQNKKKCIFLNEGYKNGTSKVGWLRVI